MQKVENFLTHQQIKFRKSTKKFDVFGDTMLSTL